MDRVHNIGSVRKDPTEGGGIFCNGPHCLRDSLLPEEVCVNGLAGHIRHCATRAGINFVGNGRQRFGNRLPAGAHTEDLCGITREVVEHFLKGTDMLKDEANRHLRENVPRIQFECLHGCTSGLDCTDDTTKVTIRNSNRTAVQVIDKPKTLRRRRVAQALCMDWCLCSHFFTPSNTKRRRVRSSS